MQSLLIAFLMISVGMFLLIKGADWLVESASSFARKLGISELIIGLTIVAIGTSTPELAVNIMAALQGNTDLTLGNVLGSNIANILLILGITGLITPIVVKSSTVWKEIPFTVLSFFVLGVMVADQIINYESFAQLSRSEGLLLLSFFAIFLAYLFESALNGTKTEAKIEKDAQSPWLLLFKGSLGLIGLVMGGNWTVEGATTIAIYAGLSQNVIGLTIVAVGTSLPELVTSVVAAKKGKTDLAIGNIVGSNILNILFVLGITAVIVPLPVSENSLQDVVFGLLASILLFVCLFLGKKHVLERWQSAIFILLYILFIAYALIRG